jgi:hypothetical protein
MEATELADLSGMLDAESVVTVSKLRSALLAQVYVGNGSNGGDNDDDGEDGEYVPQPKAKKSRKSKGSVTSAKGAAAAEGGAEGGGGGGAKVVASWAGRINSLAETFPDHESNGLHRGWTKHASVSVFFSC